MTELLTRPQGSSGPRGRAVAAAVTGADLPALAHDCAAETVTEPPVLWPTLRASTVHPLWGQRGVLGVPEKALPPEQQARERCRPLSGRVTARRRDSICPRRGCASPQERAHAHAHAHAPARWPLHCGAFSTPPQRVRAWRCLAKAEHGICQWGVPDARS